MPNLLFNVSRFFSQLYWDIIYIPKVHSFKVYKLMVFSVFAKYTITTI